jgi:hypothetical protein
MLAGSQEFAAYAQTLRRMYYAKLLEQSLEANANAFLSGVVIADLVAAPAERVRRDPPARR